MASDYVFGAELTAELKNEIQQRTQAHLTEMLGVEVDTVMAEYVVVMIGNKKSMAQITHDLVDFIGEEHAQQFVVWLSAMLPTLESPSGDHDDEDDLAPPGDDTKPAEEQTKPRIISLKGSSASSAPEKRIVSLSGSGSGSTIRTLNRSGDDVKDMLARRSQRFGVTTATTTSPDRAKGQAKNKETEPSARGNKRKAEGNEKQQRPGSAGGRLTQLLGPPVNVDQAELDARDSLNTNKRKKTGRGGDEREKGKKQDQDKDGEGNGRRQNRRRQDDDDKDGDRPPLPPNSPSDRDRNRGGRNDREGREPRGPPYQGNFRGPPGYGGYPPPPFGHPMYFPPPYGMPPYGMGFPPQGMHHQGGFMAPPMPPGPPKSHFQPRGAPRAFNKTWVNPNVAKTEGETAAAAADDATPAAGGAAPAPYSKPSNYIPRNPYYASQMRPRFQNKTWVRQDPAKEEEFSASLPQTPPPEDAATE